MTSSRSISVTMLANKPFNRSANQQRWWIPAALRAPMPD